MVKFWGKNIIVVCFKYCINYLLVIKCKGVILVIGNERVVYFFNKSINILNSF